MKVQEFLELDDRDRDAFIGKRVMGYSMATFGEDKMYTSQWMEDFKPTTTPNGMMMVIEKMRELGYIFFITDSQQRLRSGFAPDDQTMWVSFEGDNIPLNTAIAAGLALGVLEE